MTNKHLTAPPSDIALARLKVLLESVNDLYSSGKMVLESDIVFSFHEALNLFYESLDRSIVSAVMEIYAGAAADPSFYNIFTSSILKDTQAVFSEINALDKIISSSFNSIISEYDQALLVSKRVSNKLGDYLLYADPSLGAGYFFGDSFNTNDRIEVGSPLVDTAECFVSNDEGVVLLPLDGDPDIPPVKTISINANSNGEPGSNYQINVFGHEDIEVISDNEPNTWYEYERVLSGESSTPLVLDIIITLEELSVINHININPINFGTPTPIRITTIETSKNGKEYSSIKDEVPIKDYVTEQDNDEFSLSPATSKFSGQGFYSFLPRKAQYIHIVFEQHTPYTIETNNGPRLRYAIGLRDVSIVGRKFQLEGSIVSTPFTSEEEVRKVSIWASENPTEESSLADLEHFISYNDGSLWLPIQPQRRDGIEVPEVVNFNNISLNSVETEEAVKTLRHKISMKRDKKAFKGDVVIKQDRLTKTDITSAPAGGEFSVSLTEQPIRKSVNVIFPFFGSFSCPRPRYGDAVKGESTPMDLDFIEFTVDAPGERIRKSDSLPEGTLRYKLPFANIPNLEEKIRVFVNGEQIEWCSKFDTANHPGSYSGSTINADSKVYFLNKKGMELQFGYSDDTGVQRGYVPVGGSKIKVCLDGDNPFVRLTDRGYILNLSTPSDGEKESVSIVALNSLSDAETTSYEIEIPPGTEKYKDEPDVEPVDPRHDLRIGEREDRAADKIIDPRIFTKVLGATRTSTLKKTNVPIDYNVRSFLYGVGDEKPGRFSKSRKHLKATKYEETAQSVLFASLRNKKKLVKNFNKPLPTNNISNRFIPLVLEENHKNEDMTTYHGSFFGDGQEGMYPPVFVEGIGAFDIVEYDSDNEVVTGGDRIFTTKVAFQDGDTELRDSNWDKVASRYTFDPDSGTVYLGIAPAADRRTVLVCKKRDLKVIDQSFWEFDRNLVTGKIDTQKIVLDPRVVFTLPRIKAFSSGTGTDDRSMTLVSGNANSHDWDNHSIVRGTVIPDDSLFASNTKPIEVNFIDGETEFSNIVNITGESITFTSAGSNLYTFQLEQVDPTNNKFLTGNLTFASVRSTTSATTTASQFDLTPIASTGTPGSNGEWNVSSTGLVTFYLDSTPVTHVVSYRIKNIDPGIDINGLYSVDYNNGTIHFAQPIQNNGNVTYEVSVYSAFYNIAKPVHLSDIEDIDEEGKKLTFDSAFGMKFLKQDTASKARPQVLKIFYEYYKKMTESLEDLEPYFSPICKDIAFRAVTANLLEEL